MTWEPAWGEEKGASVGCCGGATGGLAAQDHGQGARGDPNAADYGGRDAVWHKTQWRVGEGLAFPGLNVRLCS